MKIEIELRGKIPAKKNRWTLLRNGRGCSSIGLRREDKDAIDSLILQARSQYRGAALEHPDMEFYTSVSSRRPDRDNIITTVLDVLVKAGVLSGDNVARCNGWIKVAPAELVSKGKDVCTILLYAKDSPETGLPCCSKSTSRRKRRREYQATPSAA